MTNSETIFADSMVTAAHSSDILPAMESEPISMPYAVTTLQLLFTGPAMAVLAGSTMPTTFKTRKNHRVPAPGERFRLFTARGPVLLEVLEREFQFLAQSTTVRLTLDIPSEP